MNIAYIASRYPAISHTFILREVVALRSRGFKVQTFTIRRVPGDQLLTDTDRTESQQTKAILPAGVVTVVVSHIAMFFSHPVNYFKSLAQATWQRPAGVRSAIWNYFYFLEAGMLARQMQRLGVRHIHAHFANVAANVAKLAATMTGGTWSLTLHGLADFGDPTRSNLRDKIAHARFVICVCDFGCGQAMLNSDPVHWPKIRRIHCGINTSVYAPKAPSEKADDSSVLRLLTVARLGPEKAHAVLLRAVRELVDRGIKVSLTCVGDGPLRDNLQSLTSELGLNNVVTFTGSIGQDDLPGYYDRADVFVLSSLAEGLPVVIMEAMAKSVPVVATCIAGIPEIIEHGVSGLLVSPGDHQGLAEAIAGLANDSDLRASIGKKGRDRVCQGFDITKTVEDLADVFREFLQPQPCDAHVSASSSTVETTRS